MAVVLAAAVSPLIEKGGVFSSLGVTAAGGTMALGIRHYSIGNYSVGEDLQQMH